MGAPNISSGLSAKGEPAQVRIQLLGDFRTVTSFLKTRQALLILDNCEHLVDACAQAAETLLHACPTLSLLATGREALGVSGELVFSVPTLATPDVRQLPLFETLAQFEAVRLFVDRAQTAFSGFTLTPDNAPAVAQVCHQLDGIPLAIELAAALVKLLRVEQIASRLDDRFHLLSGGSRTALPRHQTLQATIEWSYTLLSETERALFRRLSAFAGGWTLEAAEQVCADDLTPGASPLRFASGDTSPERRGELAPPSLTGRRSPEQSDGEKAAGGLGPMDILDLLAQLVNKSLVIAERRPGAETRYRMLETIRQYAREKLWGAGEGEQVRAQHLAYFVGLAEQAEPELRGPEMVMWLDRLEGELDNLRAALEWALESDIEAELRLASALLWFWWIRGHASEGCDRLERALSVEATERGDQLLSPARATSRGKALDVAGFLKFFQGETTRTAALSEESLSLFRQLGMAGKRGIAYALWNMAVASYVEDIDLSRYKVLIEESLALFREVGDKFDIAQCLDRVVIDALSEGDYERARAICEEDLGLRKEIGDKDGIANQLRFLGDLAYQQRDYRRAITLYEESLAGFRAVGNKTCIALVMNRLGDVALAQGEYASAHSLHEEALAIFQGIDNRLGIVYSLNAYAALAIAQKQLKRAARLFGAAESLAESFRGAWGLIGRAERDRDVAAARAALDEEAFAAAWAEGRAMTMEQAIEYALAGEKTD